MRTHQSADPKSELICLQDGICIENMHDIPYVKSHELLPETTAIMTRVCAEVRRAVGSQLACGVQILAGGNLEAVAVAQAANLQFIRAEGFVFGHVGDEGYHDSCAGKLLRYRRQIGAEDVMIFTDIKKKHRFDVDINFIEFPLLGNYYFK